MAAEGNATTTPPSPGTWLVLDELQGTDRARWIVAETSDGQRSLLAQVYSNEPASAGHRDANAALMAASKQLAESLTWLVDQVERSGAIDDHGHALALNKALLDGRALLATLPPLTALQGEN